MIYKRKSHKGKILVASLLIAGGIGLYVTYDSSAAFAQNSNLTVETGTKSAEGSRLISIVERIEAINFDEKVFTDKVFTSLEDQTIELPAPSIGRSNPFAPLGGSATAKKTR